MQTKSTRGKYTGMLIEKFKKFGAGKYTLRLYKERYTHMDCSIVDILWLSDGPIHLYLFFEKSSWKNQVRLSGFLTFFKMDFYCLCSLQKSISKSFFAGYTGSKNPFRKRLKIQFVELDFSNLIFQKISTDG